MDLKSLWEKNKLLFIIGLPLILIVVLKDFILELLVGSARKMANEARDKDAELKAKQDKLNLEAEKHKAKADAAAEKANNTDDVDENWHKK